MSSEATVLRCKSRFERSAEAFNVTTRRWDHVEEDFMDAGSSPKTCACGDDMAVYMCRGGDAVALKGVEEQVIAKLLAELCDIAYTAMWRGKLLVIG